MSVFTPLVGTPVHLEPKKHRVTIKDEAFDHGSVNIDIGTVVHRTEHLTSEEIGELWLEGRGIVVERYRESEVYEAGRRVVRERRSATRRSAEVEQVSAMADHSLRNEVSRWA